MGIAIISINKGYVRTHAVFMLGTMVGGGYSRWVCDDAWKIHKFNDWLWMSERRTIDLL